MRYSRDMYLTVSISNFFSLYPVTFAYRFLIILLYWWSVNAIFFERRNTRYLRDADRAFSARDLWVKKYQIFGGSYQCVCVYRGNAYEISPPDFRRTYLLISPFIVTIYIYMFFRGRRRRSFAYMTHLTTCQTTSRIRSTPRA